MIKIKFFFWCLFHRSTIKAFRKLVESYVDKSCQYSESHFTGKEDKNLCHYVHVMEQILWSFVEEIPPLQMWFGFDQTTGHILYLYSEGYTREDVYKEVLK